MHGLPLRIVATCAIFALAFVLLVGMQVAATDEPVLQIDPVTGQTVTVSTSSAPQAAQGGTPLIKKNPCGEGGSDLNGHCLLATVLSIVIVMAMFIVMSGGSVSAARKGKP